MARRISRRICASSGWGSCAGASFIVYPVPTGWVIFEVLAFQENTIKNKIPEILCQEFFCEYCRKAIELYAAIYAESLRGWGKNFVGTQGRRGNQAVTPSPDLKG
jgi:hypothetical protein